MNRKKNKNNLFDTILKGILLGSIVAILLIIIMIWYLNKDKNRNTEPEYIKPQESQQINKPQNITQERPQQTNQTQELPESIPDEIPQQNTNQTQNNIENKQQQNDKKNKNSDPLKSLINKELKKDKVTTKKDDNLSSKKINTNNITKNNKLVSIQVGSYNNKVSAEKTQNKLKQLNINSNIINANINGKVFYRVRILNIQKNKSNEIIDKLNKHNLPSIIISN